MADQPKLDSTKHRQAITKMGNAQRNILDVATLCFEGGLDNEAKQLRELAETVGGKIEILVTPEPRSGTASSSSTKGKGS